MPLERDLLETLADDPPEALSDRLRDQHLEQLAAVARAARRTGDSFGRRLRHPDERP
jgi:hypothetical protein